MDISLFGTSTEQTPGDKSTNVGSANTIGADMGHPGITSNQMRGIHSLHNPFQNKVSHSHQAKELTALDILDLVKSHPSEPDQPQ
jgi:hypothetical protein